jgi:hypothetical protein
MGYCPYAKTTNVGPKNLTTIYPYYKLKYLAGLMPNKVSQKKLDFNNTLHIAKKD